MKGGGGLERRLIESMNHWKKFMQLRMENGKRSYDLDRILEAGSRGRCDCFVYLLCVLMPLFSVNLLCL